MESSCWNISDIQRVFEVADIAWVAIGDQLPEITKLPKHLDGSSS